uniref:DUF4939 domain-containing protein n=1 Tax=Acanthochromis polyacanthus TaxID=80966 RepID=A0A3Q1GHD8_9TELE
ILNWIQILHASPLSAVITNAKHDQTLRSLSTNNSALFKQLSTLTEKVNQLTATASRPAATNSDSDKEPFAPTPEPYHGDFGSCQAFLTQISLVFELQPRSYSNDRLRIAYLVGLLAEDACDWGTALWRKQAPICNFYSAFVKELERNFDHPVCGQDAVSRLLDIQQGSRCVAAYAREFRTLIGMTQPSKECSTKD